MYIYLYPAVVSQFTPGYIYSGAGNTSENTELILKNKKIRVINKPIPSDEVN